MIPALTIFLGAFLVFLVQPLVGNTLLPTFGGTASVWTMCLAAFQTLLTGGYFYAHIVVRGQGMKILPMVLHAVCVVIAGTVLLCVIVSEDAAGVSALMLCIVALTYVMLSANGSLVQAVSRLKNPYRLYAVSNAGSLCGLLAYPLVFEYFLPLSAQWRLFATGVIVYGFLFAALAPGARAGSSACDEIGCNDNQSVSVAGAKTVKRSWAVYLVLSFASCFLLNAVSMHLCSDITPLPMLWCVLLALYLLSYIVAFTDRGSAWAPWAAIAVVPICGFAAYHFGCITYTEYPHELVIGFIVLFFGGWIIHSRLYRLRPAEEGLTRYYLMIALGGAAGGAFCSFIMPHVTTIVAEYPIALSMILAVVYFDWEEPLKRIAPKLEISYRTRLVRKVVVGVLVGFTFYGIIRGKSVENGSVVKRFRNFYGTGSIVRVVEHDAFGHRRNERNEFRSQNTIHGLQMLRGNDKSLLPTCYYGEIAGGQAIINHLKYKKKKPLRVALCGMGIGTLASYARKGDVYRFYEINPAVAAIANDDRYFSFLSRAEGKIDVVIDDARKALERERITDEEKWDVIMLDVFNGDSIPVHMATKEAFQLYLDRLSPGGIIAMHITNWHIDLKPAIKAVAGAFDLQARIFGNTEQGCTFSSVWAYLSKSDIPIKAEYGVRQEIALDKVADLRLMSDDFHSLLPYLTVEHLWRE